jgi:hypothetical protein
VERDAGAKDSIANVYNNSVYTPLHEFVSLQVGYVQVSVCGTMIKKRSAIQHRDD